VLRQVASYVTEVEAVADEAAGASTLVRRGAAPALHRGSLLKASPWREAERQFDNAAVAQDNPSLDVALRPLNLYQRCIEVLRSSTLRPSTSLPLPPPSSPPSESKRASSDIAGGGGARQRQHPPAVGSQCEPAVVMS
jgi:hypothetical protein